MSLHSFPNGITTPVTRIRHILYADDLRELRLLLESVLRRDGHTVDSVPDGREALERIMTAPGDYDLLITDHHMPLMNGLDLVERLRTLPFAGQIVVFSSELDEPISESYRRLRVDCILPKPIFPNTLRAVLAAL